MPKLFYRRNLPHLQRDDKPHFVTFCTRGRWILPAWARSIVLNACVRADQWTVDLFAVVVMADHVHLVFIPTIDNARAEIFSLARIMKAIKGSSSHLINKQSGTSGSIWQEESFDRVLRTSEKLDEKIAYVLDNPVRKGFVGRAEEYEWLWVAEKFCNSAELRSAGQVRHLPLRGSG